MSQIQPFFGDEPITSSNVEVRVDAAARTRALAIVELAKEVPAVVDEESFSEARQVAAQLKAVLDQIEADRKAAKLPFTSVGRAIDQVASDLSAPVKTAQNRILGMLGGYVTKLEAERKAEERRVAEEKRIAQEKADRELREAQEANAQARAELQAARDDLERAMLREVAQLKENALLQQQLAAELAADVEELGQPTEAPRGLVPGGRVDHVYEFELVNVKATVDAGCWRLLKWTLDIRACQDAVKNLVECAPNLEPELPGIRITKRLNVSVKAASRIK